MTGRPEGVGDIDYLPDPWTATPTVEVSYCDPVGTILGPSGAVIAHVWPERPPAGFTRSDR